MKLDRLKILDIQNIGDSDTGIQAGITAESLPFVFEMLSKQLYSNPIGSIVREITSNCSDSHQEAGVNEPIIIKKSYDEDEGYTIEFQDFGVGISPDRMSNIYMNYFSSSKRGTNEQIGGFGLGSKTPLAYADFFYINTIFNRIKYDYIFHKGENKPTLDLLKEEETEEGNGTTIKLVMENESDIRQFRTELEQQLLYFDNVYFEGWNINNKYTIYEGEYFKFRSDINQRENNVHISINKVKYNLDFDKVHVLTKYKQIPIAVKFEIGELQITPNRETLRYTDDTINLITKRVSLAIEEIIGRFNKQNPEVETLEEYHKLQGQEAKIVFNIEEGHSLNLWQRSELSRDLKFKPLAGIKIKKTPKELFFGWEIVGRISSEVYIPYKAGAVSLNNISVINGNYVIVDKDIKFSMYTTINIDREVTKFSTIFVVRKKKIEDFFYIDRELGLLSSNMEQGKAKIIYAYNKVIDSIVKERSLGYYKDFKPTDEWITAYKKEQKEASLAFIRKQNKEVFIRIVAYNSTGGKDIKLSELNNRTGILVYGFKEDKNKLFSIQRAVADNVSSIYKNYVMESNHYVIKKSFTVIQIAQNVETHILESKKTIYCDDFIETKFFRKIYSAQWLKSMISNSKILTNGDMKSILLRDYKKDISLADEYYKKYFKGGSVNLYVLDVEKLKIMPEAVEIYSKLYDKYNDVHFPMENIVEISSIHSNDIKEYIEYLKFKKIRLPNKFYLKDDRQLEYESNLREILRLINSPYKNNLLTFKENQNDDNSKEETSISAEEYPF